MKASERIRNALAQVEDLRQAANQSANLSTALQAIKTWQSERFTATYRDLLGSQEYAGCARFFLEELYSERDYRHRDEQFARVAGAIELTFPEHVIEIAVELAELHATTERLDLAMARHWDRSGAQGPAQRYADAWQQVNEPNTRYSQLVTVLRIGRALSNLTQKRGLRLLLKMMHRPAELAGLAHLQSFLETGFDQFGQLAKTHDHAEQFLAVIEKRELAWLDSMFGKRPGVAS